MSDGFLCPMCSKPVTSTTGCVHFPVRKNDKKEDKDNKSLSTILSKLKQIYDNRNI